MMIASASRSERRLNRRAITASSIKATMKPNVRNRIMVPLASGTDEFESYFDKKGKVNQ
jgi:hypothetical protein